MDGQLFATEADRFIGAVAGAKDRVNVGLINRCSSPSTSSKRSRGRSKCHARFVTFRSIRREVGDSPPACDGLSSPSAQFGREHPNAYLIAYDSGAAGVGVGGCEAKTVPMKNSGSATNATSDATGATKASAAAIG